MPFVASPALRVTACCSAIPTSKALLGIFFIMIFSDEPEGIAGVIPIIFSFFSASSTIECPKTSWYLGGLFLFDFTARLSPELISNLPVACHLVWSFSAKSYPLPFLVKQWRIFGPGIFLRYSRVLTRWFMSWPSIGPKYLKFSASNKFELSKSFSCRWNFYLSTEITYPKNVFKRENLLNF